MDPQTGKAAFTFAIFITITSLALLPFEPPDSAEFVITVASLVVGVVFVAVVTFFVRRSSK